MSIRLPDWLVRYTLVTAPFALAAGILVHFHLGPFDVRKSSFFFPTFFGFLATSFILSPLIRNPGFLSGRVALNVLVGYIHMVLSAIVTSVFAFGPTGAVESLMAVMWVHFWFLIYLPASVIHVAVVRNQAGVPLRDRAISVAEAERMLDIRR